MLRRKASSSVCFVVLAGPVEPLAVGLGLRCLTSDAICDWISVVLRGGATNLKRADDDHELLVEFRIFSFSVRSSPNRDGEQLTMQCDQVLINVLRQGCPADLHVEIVA